MRIAVIGAGISGLTAAYRLQRQHDVTVLEANDYVGGHTNTVDVEFGGERQAVDTGFIVFNERTYPNFIRLLDELGVASQPTEMSFSVQCGRTGLEYRGGNLNGLFAQRRNLVNWRFYRLLRDLLRFNRLAEAEYEKLDDTVTVGEFFSRKPFSREFREQYFLPMGSAVWSCPHSTFEQFPIRFIIQFYRHHGMLSVSDRLPWRVVRGGSKQYVQAMLSRFRNPVRTGCRVRGIQRDESGVAVHTAEGSPRFDHVVLACHSDQALRILGNGATEIERELLGAFPYERNVALLHTDRNALPHSRRAWASWNYYVPPEASRQATVTYNMNILQGLRSRHLFCVTLNGEDRVAPQHILRRIEYHHPIFTASRAAAQRRHAELIGHRRTSYCGAYWGNGFHEDGVNSALAVCRYLEQESCTAVSTRGGSDTGASSPSGTPFVMQSS